MKFLEALAPRNRVQGCHFARAFMLALLILSPQCSGDVAGPTEIFKRLLSDPPNIAEMVYQDKLPQIINRPTPLDVGLAGSSNTATYRLVWQPQAMFFQSLAPPGASHGISELPHVPAECFGMWEDSFYFLDPGQFAFVYQLNSERIRFGAFPPPYHAALFKQARACEPLNLGINHLKPGAVQWDGDEFKAIGSADQKPMYIRGKITGWTNQIPNEMQIQYSNDMSTAQYRLAYLYEGYTPPYYPKVITSYYLNRGKEIEYRSYRILSVAVTNRAQPKAAFGMEKYIESHGMLLRWMTNGTLYSQLPSGALIQTPGAMPKLKLTAEDYFANRYYYVAVALTTLIFFVFVGKEKSLKY